MTSSSIVIMSALAASVAGAARSAADPVADFYRNATINVVMAGSAGGIHALYTQLLTPYMRKYMPGNPQLVINHQTGAGGMIAANFLYNLSPKDGSAIGVLLPEMPLTARLGTQSVKYDPAKFLYIAGADVTNSTITLMRSAGINSIADARQKEAVIAAGGPGSQTYVTPMAANLILGTKFKVVAGYNGLAAIDLAVDKGEADGRSGSWSSIKATRAQWLSKDMVVHLAVIGPDREPDLPNVPLLTEFATTPSDRTVLDLISDNAVLGRAWLAPPGVPAERIAALRDAFWKALNDPELVAEARIKSLDLRPVTWQKLTEVVDRTMRAGQPAVDRLKSIMERK